MHSRLAFVPSAAGRLRAAARHPAPSSFIGRRLRLDAINRHLDHETRLRLVELLQPRLVAVDAEFSRDLRKLLDELAQQLLLPGVIGADAASD